MPRDRHTKVTMHSLAVQLETILTNQLTKSYFDSEISGIDERINNAQELTLKEMDLRLKQVENAIESISYN